MKRFALGLLAVSVVAGCGNVAPLQSNTSKSVGTASVKTKVAKIEHASVREAKALIESSPNMLLLDVREPDEFAEAHIRYFQNKPLSKFEEWSAGMDKEAPVLLVCRSGRRSMIIAELMVNRGFQQVFNLDGGMVDWVKAGYPTVK